MLSFTKISMCVEIMCVRVCVRACEYVHACVSSYVFLITSVLVCVCDCMWAFYVRANENKCITYIQCVNPVVFGLIITLIVMFPCRPNTRMRIIC